MMQRWKHICINEGFVKMKGEVSHGLNSFKARVPTVYVLSRNKKIMHTPCKPQFYYIKMGFKRGGQHYIGMFSL